VKIRPKDSDAVAKMKACEKAVFEEAFNKAIEVDDTAKSGPKVDVDSIVVESTYDGPRLPDAVSEASKSGKSSSKGSSSAIRVTMEFVEQMIERFRDQKLVHRKYVIQILLAARDMFKNLPSLLRITLPSMADGSGDVSSSSSPAPISTPGHFTVCGDTHGQYYDLLNIFKVGGMPSESNPYLFNGDFVDRGSFSFETVFTLIAMRLACPTGLYMLRGNHETK
jgi:serine/threonine-protein phosphatase 5